MYHVQQIIHDTTVHVLIHSVPPRFSCILLYTCSQAVFRSCSQVQCCIHVLTHSVQFLFSHAASIHVPLQCGFEVLVYSLPFMVSCTVFSSQITESRDIADHCTHHGLLKETQLDPVFINLSWYLFLGYPKQANAHYWHSASVIDIHLLGS